MAETVLAIDPGTTHSAWVLFDGDAVDLRGYEPNESLRDWLTVRPRAKFRHIAIEFVESFGMPVGREVFETVYWIGRFAEAWGDDETLTRLSRKDVKLNLCQSARAKDANIRQALLDRFPATGGGSVPQVGTKKMPGPLYGIASHTWSALAVAVTWFDSRAKGKQ